MSEERLKRVEILLETCAKNTIKNEKQIDRLTIQIATLSDMFTDTVRIIKQQQSEIKEMQADVKQMQSEIKGLQTENKRILDRLFGEEEN